MNINTIKENAKEKMKGFCNLCKECNGIWCAGNVPGMGGTGTGESFKRNYKMLKKYKLMMRTLHDVKDPELGVEMFGEKLSFPAFIAPITGTKFNMGGGVTEDEYASDVVRGAIESGTIAMIGDTGDPTCYQDGLKHIKECGGKGIAIIKPRANEEVIKRIRMAEEAGVLAVGMDVDGAGLITMKLFGQPVGPKSLEDLQEIISSTKLPFIVKGVMSVDEAKICVEAGAAAIVVSNHGGRCLNETLAPIEVLKEIVDKVGEKIIVLADGNVREGVDIFKYLALGAKAILVGRPVIWGSIGGREEGVKIVLDKMKNELYQAMILSGSKDIKSIDEKKVRCVMD